MILIFTPGPGSGRTAAQPPSAAALTFICCLSPSSSRSLALVRAREREEDHESPLSLRSVQGPPVRTADRLRRRAPLAHARAATGRHAGWAACSAKDPFCALLSTHVLLKHACLFGRQLFEVTCNGTTHSGDTGEAPRALAVVRCSDHAKTVTWPPHLRARHRLAAAQAAPVRPPSLAFGAPHFLLGFGAPLGQPEAVGTVGPLVGALHNVFKMGSVRVCDFGFLYRFNCTV